MGAFFRRRKSCTISPRNNISPPPGSRKKKGAELLVDRIGNCRLRSRNPGENLKCKNGNGKWMRAWDFVATILGRLVDDPLPPWMIVRYFSNPPLWGIVRRDFDEQPSFRSTSGKGQREGMRPHRSLSPSISPQFSGSVVESSSHRNESKSLPSTSPFSHRHTWSRSAFQGQREGQGNREQARFRKGGRGKGRGEFLNLSSKRRRGFVVGV